jgi:hypothetical protein
MLVAVKRNLSLRFSSMTQSITDRQTADAQSIFFLLNPYTSQRIDVSIHSLLDTMKWYIHVQNLFWKLKNFWRVLIAFVGSYNIILFFGGS